ncbi:MAG: DUF2061 domain-containing protein [Hyphomicrobiales bacterium]
MNGKKTKKDDTRTKDSPTRSILKAVSWRVIASGITFLMVYVIFRRYSQQTSSETLQTASFVTAVEMVAKLVAYYLHERMWTNIKWGKTWVPSGLRKRAWKKLYRKMHAAEA